MSQYNSQLNYAADITKTAEYQQELAAQRTFMNRVYLWMTVGLAVTTLASVIVATSHDLTQLFLANRGARMGLGIAALLVALVFIFAQRKLPAAVAGVLFIVYSALVGLTTGALILAIFPTATVVVPAFIVTAGTFAAMTIYGYTTKRDLTGLGSFLMMGLFGLILASIVTMLFGGANPMMQFIICMVGVIVFTGLTAYDTQKIKQSYAEGEAGTAVYKKAAIYGAFELYLDFVNLFIYLVQLFGRRD